MAKRSQSICVAWHLQGPSLASFGFFCFWFSLPHASLSTIHTFFFNKANKCVLPNWPGPIFIISCLWRLVDSELIWLCIIRQICNKNPVSAAGTDFLALFVALLFKHIVIHKQVAHCLGWQRVQWRVSWCSLQVTGGVSALMMGSGKCIVLYLPHVNTPTLPGGPVTIHVTAHQSKVH